MLLIAKGLLSTLVNAKTQMALYRASVWLGTAETRRCSMADSMDKNSLHRYKQLNLR